MNLLLFFLPLFVVGCDLKCFLAGLEVNVGSLSYEGRFALSKYSVDIADLKCGNISMASFDSGWNGEQEYTLGVLGVGIDCLGGYVAKWGLLHEHGEVSAGGGGGNINATSLLVNNQTSGMAEGITMTACQSSFVIDVWFTGPKWLQDLEKDFHRRLQKDISDAVNKAACNFLRELDADQVSQWIQVLNSDLTAFLEPPTPAMWPLAPWDARLQSMENSSFVNLLDFLVERLLGPQGINGALAVVNLTHIEFPIRTHFAPIVGRGANTTFALKQLDVQGAFDTWTAFSLKPAGDYAVRFTAAIAGPLEFTLLFAGNVTTTTGGDTFNSKGTIKFVVSNITFDFNALVYANASFYDELSFVGLENCPLNGMINVGILRLFTDLTVQSFNVSSLSPNGALEDSFATAVDNAFRMIIANYRQFIPPFVDAFLETMVQPRVDEILQSSLLGKNDSCAQTPQQRDSEATVGLNMMAVIISLSAWSFVLIIIWITLWCVDKRNAGLSLAWAEDTSTIAKVLVPATAVFCFSVNMITAASTSATLRLRLGFGPNVLVSSALYTMNMAGSLRQAWNAGVYQMALVVVVFQIIVPYTKLLFVLACWYFPNRWWNDKYRLYILYIFDCLGRFQLISGFILVVYSIAFHFFVSTQGSVPDPVSTVESFIVVHTQFWLFMSIGIVSMILTTYMLRRVRTHYYGERVVPLESKRRPTWVNACVTLSLGTNAVLLALGYYFSAFSLEFMGLGGYVLSLVGMPKVRVFSLIGAGLGLRTGWLDSESVAAYGLQVLFFALSIVAPCLQMLGCFFAWGLKGRWGTFDALEIVGTWACLDVFMAAVLSSVVSLSRYASFIVGDHCDAINAWMRRYAEHALDEPVCIDLTSHLLLGTGFLVAACVLLFVNTRLILYWVKPYTDDIKKDVVVNTTTTFDAESSRLIN